jgi:adenosylcobinamide-GDP ribazoletransferase
MPNKRTTRDYSQYLMHSRKTPGLGQTLRAQLKELVAAIRFLSILPIPGSAQLFDTEDEDADLIIGAAYFPFVGLLIALVLLALLLATSRFFPPLVLAAFLVVAQVVLTGGLHMDGLMDSSDGLFGGSSPERRLEIMRDSRVGSFGVLAGGCVLLLKFAVFATLRVHLLALAVLMVLPAARWAMIMTVSLFPSARPTGLGAAFRQTLSVTRLVVAGITALIVVLVVGHLPGLLVLLVGTLAAIAVGAWATRRLGGLTGDSYGAIAEVAEVVMLLLIVVLNAWFV